MRGLIVLDGTGEIVTALGTGRDARIQNLAQDADWIDTARDRRVVPVLLTDARMVAVATDVDAGTLLVFSEVLDETVLQFFLGVDFSYDILHHILTDPFEALNIVDADGKVVYLSPTHEKYLGLQPGESVGRPVRDVIPNTRLHEVVKNGVSEVGQLQRFKGYERVVSRHPIRHDGSIVGAIGRVMFKGPEQVEMLSQRVNALEEEIESYRQESAAQRKSEQVLEAIVGQSFAIQSVREQIRKIAPLDIPVLIQGDSGTGKELVAQALHRLSLRHDGPLVTVNAAALPATLVESELFGYEPGSFTGANRKGRKGKFEQADKGTIFLDEIGDMPLEVQTKLLRVLQDRMVERVGGEKARRIDFRLCCATNHDLEQLVEAEKFRLDLFYRVSPIAIKLPSLEERLEDIPMLVRHFLVEFAEQYARPLPEVEADVYAHLAGQAWPGNVRQLRHEVERAFVMADLDRLRVIDFSHSDAGAKGERTNVAAALFRASENGQGRLKETLEQVEDELIHNAMLQFKGNKKRVAEHLGISRSYLYKKLEVTEQKDTRE
jgi:PAS domain S-box-containing protein